MAEIRGKSDFTKWCYFSRMTPENITPVKSRCGRTAYCYLFAPLIQVCSDNETPFTLPEPISVDQHDTVTTHHHQQQHQQVLESRDHSDWPADATHTQTNGVRHAVHTSSRPSSVKVSHVWRWVCAWLIVKYLKCFVGNRYRLILVISHLRMQSSISRRGCRLGPKGAAPALPAVSSQAPNFATDAGTDTLQSFCSIRKQWWPWTDIIVAYWTHLSMSPWCTVVFSPSKGQPQTF